MPPLFDIEGFRQRRQPNEAVVQLLGTFQNNFRPIVVLFYLSSDFYNFARQLPDVTNLLKIMLEYHYAESAKPVIVAEVEIVHASFAGLNANHFAGDALCFIKMIARLIERKASREG